MEYRELGRTGIAVSPLCLGAMMFGAWGNPDHDDSIRIIHRALDAGINFIDTADVYSRRRVRGDRRQGARRRPARRRRARDQVPRRRWATTPTAAATRAAGSCARSRTACAGCGTDWIDLYQIHRPDADTDIDETLGALTDLVRAGQGPLLRLLDVPGARDRRGPVGRRAPRPRAVRVRAAAVLDPRARRSRPTCCRSAQRYGMGVISLEPAGRRLAVRPLPQGRRRCRAAPRGRAHPAALRPVAARQPAQARGRRRARAARRRRPGYADPAGDRVRPRATRRSPSAIIGPRTMEQLESQLGAADVDARRRRARPDRRDRPARHEPQPGRRRLPAARPRRPGSPPAASRRRGEGHLAVERLDRRCVGGVHVVDVLAAAQPRGGGGDQAAAIAKSNASCRPSENGLRHQLREERAPGQVGGVRVRTGAAAPARAAAASGCSPRNEANSRPTGGRCEMRAASAVRHALGDQAVVERRPAAWRRGRGSSARRRCRSRAPAPSSGTSSPCPAPTPRRLGGRLFMIPAWLGEANRPIAEADQQQQRRRSQSRRSSPAGARAGRTRAPRRACRRSRTAGRRSGRRASPRPARRSGSRPSAAACRCRPRAASRRSCSRAAAARCPAAR